MPLGTNASGQPVVFAAFWAVSRKFIDEAAYFAEELNSYGASLVVGMPDMSALGDIGKLNFDVITIGDSLIKYAPQKLLPGATSCDLSFYDQWLVDTERAWWGGVFTEKPRETTIVGLHSCRNKAFEVLQAVNPSVALIWGAGMYPAACIWLDIARNMGIPSFSFERGQLPGTWTVDSGGMAFQSDLRTHPLVRQVLLQHQKNNRIKQYRQWYLARQPETYDPSRQTIPRLSPQVCRERLRSSEKLITVFGSITHQSLLIPTHSGKRSHDRSLVNNSMLLDAIRNVLAQDKNISVVFKPHPGESKLFQGKLGEDILTVEDIHPCDLIMASDVIVSGFTTLSVETLLLQKPLVHTVNSFLYGTGAVFEATEHQHLYKAIHDAMDRKKHHEKKKRAEFLLDALLCHELYSCTADVPAMPMKALADHCLGLAHNERVAPTRKLSHPNNLMDKLLKFIGFGYA